MNSVCIFDTVNEIVEQYGTRDPDAIAEAEGVDIYYSSNLKKLLGMYTHQWGKGIIIVNDNLDVPMKRIVIAHEVGHSELHRELAQDDGLMEFGLLNTTGGIEHEANLFAAHLLLTGDEVYNLLKQGYDIGTVSKMLSTDPNLLLIKIREMNKLGYNIPLTNEYDGKFLNRISENLS